MDYPEIEFLDWLRPETSSGGTRGRALRSAVIKVEAVTNSDPAATATSTVTFAYPGPGDVQSLRSAAIIRTYPSPGAVDAEATRCAYVELAAADLPWRYSPHAASPHSWLAVLAGAEGSDLRLAPNGSQVELVGQDTYAQIARSSQAGAHVQRRVGQPQSALARVVCPSQLPPSSSCIAVVVPAFTPDGGTWPKETSSLPVYFSWRFSTGDGEDFVSIASRLRRREVTGLGTAKLTVPWSEAALELHAALRPIGAGPLDSPPPDVIAHTASLSDGDTTGPRPLLCAPDYLREWAGNLDAPFRVELNGDPRDRGAAGLGADDVVRHQEPLVRGMLAQAGDYRPAAGRIAALSGGLLASRALWSRRVPSDELDRLALVGPALRGLMLDAGEGVALTRSVADATSGADALPRGIVSSAARRALRSRRASNTAPRMSEVIESALRQPLATDTTPFDPGFYDQPEVAEVLGEMTRPEPVAIAIDAPPVERRQIAADVRAIASDVADLFDPTRDDGPQVQRVGSSITGLTTERLIRPLEICESLDVATWTYLRDAHPEFLLHGIGELARDSMVAMEVDDRFVDGYLVGLNAQVLAELRFRNITVAAGCTPLRRFWARASSNDGGLTTTERDDIRGVDSWSAGSALGDAQHREHPSGQLVLLFRTILFHRYPATMVSLRQSGKPERDWPTFGGAVSDEVVFFGFDVAAPADGSLNAFEVILEDPPHGVRFISTGELGDLRPAEWASNHVELPIQVIIAGDYLDGEL